MTDVDLLVRQADHERAQAVMLRNHFAFTEHSGVHDVYRSPGDLYDVELHERLLSDWFEQGTADGDWAHATHEQGCRYGLNARERYVLAAMHAKKHLLTFGVKLRDVLELELLRRDPDAAGADDELERLGALDQAQLLSGLARGWFEGAQQTEAQLLLGEYIFASNEPTNTAQHRLNAENAWYRRNRWSHDDRGALRRFFPPLSEMQQEYRVLQRIPAFLPVCWMLRWPVTLYRATVHGIRRTAASRNGAIDLVKELRLLDCQASK